MVGLDGQSAAVLDGCFRGRSVTDEFNLTDALAFFESYATTAEEVSKKQRIDNTRRKDKSGASR